MEQKKELMGYLMKKKKKWEEKEIGKMGLQRRGDDFLAIAAEWETVSQYVTERVERDTGSGEEEETISQ